ncbi:MAG: ParB N-terminal domain-containing protein, partial [Nanoarchaeota archaeon]
MEEIPQVQKIDINLLKVDGKNPNRMSKEQKEALKENIRKFGFITPIITNQDYLIADGEHRWLMAKEMGFNEIPVIRLDIEEVDRRILRQVLNKLKGAHDWDLDKL